MNSIYSKQCRVMNELILSLDDDDHKVVQEAMAMREHVGPLPKGQGNINGRAIAEICRGWIDYSAWFSYWI